MFKQTVIILLLSISFVSIVYCENEIIDESKLIELHEMELLIDQQLFHQYINRLEPQVSKSNVKALGGTATINGHVEDITTANLVGHDVTLYELLGNEVAYVISDTTDVNGDYSFTNLTAGIYLVLTGSQTDEYLDYIWQSDVPLICNFPQRCSENMASHINLPDAAILNNFNFSIALGGKILGAIIDAGTLDGVGTLSVNLTNIDFDQGRNYLFTSMVDQVTGSYLIQGIPDGDYRVYLQPRFDLDNIHISQVYGGPECNLCIREAALQGIGSILTLNSATNINNINFNVNIGASINGFVLDNNTANPLAVISIVRIFSEFNNILGIKLVQGTDNIPTTNGSYLLGGLLPGSYYVQAGDSGRDFYQRELYNNIPCYFSGCDRGTGNAVALNAQENRLGVNFLLEKGGKISGTVTDATTGLPILATSPVELQVEFYNNIEQVVGSAFIKSDGTYTSARAVPVGTYSARTGSMFQGQLLHPYVNQKYSGIDCAGLACDLSATNIVVTNDATTSGIDFALSTGNSFSGTVTDIATSAPIGGVHVLVYKEMSVGVVKFANWATTSYGSNGVLIGDFEVTGLPDGTYFARTGYGSDLPFFVSSFHNIGGVAPIGWIDSLYENMPCLAGCDVTLGTPIVLPAPVVINKSLAGSSTINFALTQGAIITGQVKGFIDKAPLPEITINVFNNQGAFMGSSITDSQGKYITRGLPDGTYYLTTTSFDVLLDVKYGNDFCQPGSCDPLQAQPITVANDQQATDKDFVLKTAFMHIFSDDFE